MTDGRGIRFGHPFGTPLLDYGWPDSAGLDAASRAAILAEEAGSPGAALTNVGGWHSETGDLAFCGKAGAVRPVRPEGAT